MGFNSQDVEKRDFARWLFDLLDTKAMHTNISGPAKNNHFTLLE